MSTEKASRDRTVTNGKVADHGQGGRRVGVSVITFAGLQVVERWAMVVELWWSRFAADSAMRLQRCACRLLRRCGCDHKWRQVLFVIGDGIGKLFCNQVALPT